MLSGVFSAAHLEFHCRILKQLAVRRAALRLVYGLQAQVADTATDVYDVLVKGVQGFQRLLDGSEVVCNLHDMDEVMRLTLEAGLKRKATAHNGLTGVDTGLTELNRMSGGR